MTLSEREIETAATGNDRLQVPGSATGSDTAPALVTTGAEIARRLADHAAAAAGALSPNTERAIRGDSATWSAWCADRGLQAVPAAPATVAAFVDDQAETKAPATVRRLVATISHLHRAAGVPTPIADERVKLALKRMNRARGTRQNQAKGLCRRDVDRMLDATPADLVGLRDRALLATAYDSLLRRAELVALDVDDLEADDDGAGRVMVRRSKTDQDGRGSFRFVAGDTLAAVRAWLNAAGIEAGPLFRGVRRSGRVLEGRLGAGEVSRRFKRMAERAGIDAAAVSGHSTRIGGACDLVAAGVDLPALMTAGGWQTSRMPARYSERLETGRGAMARLARLQGRA